MEIEGRQYAFREGMTVYGADGDKVGKVVAADPGYVVVEKGFFFPTDYYIPTTAIASVDEEHVHLAVSKAEALNQGWDQPLTATTTEGDERFRATTTDAEAFAASGAGYPATGTSAPFGADRTAATSDAYGGQSFEQGLYADQTQVQEGERISVPVHEEELVATTRPVEAGAVRIEKEVVTEDREITVPVAEERVRVTRVAADRDSPADEATAFEEGVLEVPLRREEVDLQKRTRVAGEVEVEKEAVHRTERVAGTVRREEVRVDERALEGAEIVRDGDPRA